jgi:hypothetical protein
MEARRRAHNANGQTSPIPSTSTNNNNVVTPSSPPPQTTSSNGNSQSKSPIIDDDNNKDNTNGTTSNNKKRLTVSLLTLVIFLLIWRGLAFWAEWSDMPDDDLEVTQAPIVKPNSNKKKILGDADVVEVKARSGWSPQLGSLVEKRPPRPCLTTNIATQVFDPIIYVGKNKDWKRRAYACMIKSGCRQGLLEDAEDRRWKRVKSLDVTFIFINEPTLKMLPVEAFKKLYFEREGSTYIDVILGGISLSGNHYQQFDSRQTYVKGFGCSMNDLNIQLASYRSNVLSECLDVKEQATKASRLSFTVHSLKDDSTTSLTSAGILQKIGDCKASASASTDPVLIVRNLAKSLLIDKSKFVVRAFLLVGSTMPFMVFYRRGYVRVARESGSGMKDVSLEDFQRTLANGKITGTHFVDTFLKASMKRIALLLFQASRQSMERRRGTYQLYSLDFVVDDQLRVYLDSSEPYPTLISTQDVPNDASMMIAEMHDLVMELNEEPTAFDTMITGDKYGMFELIFSEIRETCEGALWNPCHQFHDYNSKPLARANKKISAAHNAANREHHEETRVKKKLDEEKKKICKEQHLSFESKSCDKLWKQLEDEEFEKLFAEHEKDWNPNAFKMAKPGDVFPWEMV